jgi:hypothetical protein
MRKSRCTRAAAILATVLFVAACAAGANDVAQAGTAHVAGFWPGLWHGLISPITFIVGLFDHDVNVYDVHNNGNWYNFGFMMGVSTVFSTLGRSGPAGRSMPARCGDKDKAERT